MSDQNMTNKQIYKNNQKMIEEQDERLDEIIQGLDKTKYITGQIGDEVKKQDPLLDELKGDMNRIDSRMRKANDKITALISSQSYCCLYMIIMGEVAVLLLLILLV